ncbi:hypothetical protein KBT16_10970 [Nostoc sp. CCCryo 231-06]|nr:hypothetical protein [Nostoc sp. CCCryo 231-06]
MQKLGWASAGHKDVKTTMIYTLVLNRARKAGCENLNISNPLLADITHVVLDCHGYNHNAAQNQHHLESNVPKIVAAKFDCFI